MNGNHILHEPEKELAARARGSPIESENKFIEMSLEMLRMNTALMCAQEHPLQE